MKIDVLRILDPNAMEDGAWLHIKSPDDGEPLYRDPVKKLFPCRALIRSSQSKVHTATAFRENARNRTEAEKLKADEMADFLEASTKRRMARNFADALVALENCSEEDPGIVHPSDEDKLQWAEEADMNWLVVQIVSFSDTMGNFKRAGEAHPPKPAVPARAKRTSAAS